MKPEINFSDVLENAVREPGKIMAAYSAFHSYSFGNQMLAMLQLSGREIPIGPIATFKTWKDRGRSVMKGQKAIALCMPVSVAAKDKQGEPVLDKDGEPGKKCFFVLRNNWFALAQTDGDTFDDMSYRAPWDRSRALATLGIQEIPYAMVDGNIQGYATEKDGKPSVAINPLAQLPMKTLFHELGHIVLGHIAENQSLHSDERTPRDIREVEAESVALLCISALGLPGAEFCRGYIQGWIKTDGIPEKSAKRIFSATDKILKAGKEVAV